MSRAVHIVATGARTPVGMSAETTAAAIRAGISRLESCSAVLDPFGDPVRGAMDGVLDPELRGWERLAELAKTPLLEVGRKLTESTPWPHPVDVVVALPEVRPAWTDADAQQVLRALATTSIPGLGPLRITEGERGHAGVLAAMDAAAKRIASGMLDLCIVGGADSYFDPATILWLQRNGQLVMDEVPVGFPPGEGAGFVALASTNGLRSLRLAPLATVAGTGTAHETRLIKTDSVNLGAGLKSAVRGATTAVSEPVDMVFCDINGERYRSEEWAFVALALTSTCRDATGFELPSSCWGDVGAASGALFTSLAVGAWQRGYARGPRALLWTGSEKGLRAAAVLQQEH